MTRYRISLLGLALLLGACRQGSDENLGVAGRSDAPLDLTGLDQPGRLEAVLAAEAEGVERKLGPHQRQQTTKLVVRSGERSDTLEEFWRTEFDARGALHAVHETSRDEGIEWYLVGGDLFVRPRHGRFVRRHPQGDEVSRARDEQSRALAGYLGVLGRFATREEKPMRIGDRPAVRVTLRLDPQAAPSTEEDPARAWRRSLHVQALDGTVTLDAASGAVLEAHLEANYSFLREGAAGDKGREISVQLAYRSLTRQGGVAPLAAPSDALPALARPRPLLDRATLLEGLVPTRGE
ncbi:MAG TPA: hypothetical protein VH877_16690 [Polyangia bacterium]|nr:hypothetical protein [Polyangia bacterium]